MLKRDVNNSRTREREESGALSGTPIACFLVGIFQGAPRPRSSEVMCSGPSDPSAAAVGGPRTFLIKRRGDEIIRERVNKACRMRRDLYRSMGSLAQSSPRMRASSLAKRLCKSKRGVSWREATKLDPDKKLTLARIAGPKRNSTQGVDASTSAIQPARNEAHCRG